MNYLKRFSEAMSDEDAENLKNLLQSLSHSMSRLKSYAQFQNRKSAMNEPNERGVIPNSNKLKDEYEEMFYTMIDDGWIYFREGLDFYSKIYLKKPIRRDKAEEEFDNILKEMMGIKNRFDDRGFNCHFMIYFDGQGQQELNPQTHKNDIYKFKGVGEANWMRYSDEFKDKYPQEEYFLAKIEFIYI